MLDINNLIYQYDDIDRQQWGRVSYKNIPLCIFINPRKVNDTFGSIIIKLTGENSWDYKTLTHNSYKFCKREK